MKNYSEGSDSMYADHARSAKPKKSSIKSKWFYSGQKAASEMLEKEFPNREKILNWQMVSKDRVVEMYTIYPQPDETKAVELLHPSEFVNIFYTKRRYLCIVSIAKIDFILNSEVIK